MQENNNIYKGVRSECSGNNPPETDNTKTNLSIVGIGSSAGGLDALLAFFGNVPENSGLAFVLVQHMEKLGEDILIALLQTATNMKVVMVNENMPVQPNNVYVISPEKNTSICNNVLNISEYTDPQTLHLPIDFFFNSLAEDKGPDSIGVILSGMGSDGISGLRKVKENGGVVFVQDPSSAKFDGMPKSVIQEGLADTVSNAEDLPSKIILYLQNKNQYHNTDGVKEDRFNRYFDIIMGLIKKKVGHDFSYYKKSTVRRRIERRMSICKINTYEDYIGLLKENPQEPELLFNEFLIGVSSFFREPLEWELLKEKVIPSILAERKHNDTIRAWVSGCSTGQEAYSLAMVFDEVLHQLNCSQCFSLQIFATDLDIKAIDKARNGVFPVEIEKEMSPERLKRYFVKTDQGYQIVKPIRDMVIFAQQNMIKDPPFTKLDILSCRNLLIYLTAEMQKKLIPIFHYSLNPGGILFLGSAETAGEFNNMFKQIDRSSRIYQRLQPALKEEYAKFHSFFTTELTEVKHPSLIVNNIKSAADKLILEQYSPATVLVNTKGDILYISGRIGKYLEMAPGNVNWNIFAMARDGLYYELNNAFFKVLNKKEDVTLTNAVVKNEGGSQMVDISIKMLKEPEELCGMIMIVFTDAAPASLFQTTDSPAPIPVGSGKEKELEHELIQTRQMWQAANTELQLCKEEFKTRTEEFQSINEEFQSTNEELSTTKEELHSLNEQLKSVNLELENKLNTLIFANEDMKNQMNSMKIAAIFLDNNLCIKFFTSEMTEISRLISSDVGRPFTDIASDLIYPELTEDVAKVMESLVLVEKHVISNNGSWYNI